MKMPERGRRPHSSDAYAEYKSRDWDNSQDGNHYLYSGRGRNQKPRDTDKRRSAGGTESKPSRQRDTRSVLPNNESHVYGHYNLEGVPGL